MTKIKNMIIYLICLIIVFTSFKMPEILLDLENPTFEMEVYEKESEKGKIDVEAEKIYLVKAIHSIENEKNTVLIGYKKSAKYTIVEDASSLNENDNIASLQKELLKLNEYKILRNSNFIIDNTDIEIIDKIYHDNKEEFIINSISIQTDDMKYELEYELEKESKTGKILYIMLNKNDLYSNNKEEILENYIKYLDLYIIDDWKFESKIIKSEKPEYDLSFEYNMLKSEKAGLVVTLRENNDNYILTIHNADNFDNIAQYISE